MKKKLLLTFIFCAALTIQAQQTFPAGGGEAVGSDGSSSFSLGQLMYTTNTGSGGTTIRGVQQSFELYTLSNSELAALNLTAVCYPNPTLDYIVLKISEKAPDNLSYQLIDVNGNIISKRGIANTNTQIKMEQYAIGMYILKVQQNNQDLKTFKIIKK